MDEMSQLIQHASMLKEEDRHAVEVDLAPGNVAEGTNRDRDKLAPPPDRIQPAPPGMHNPHLQARLDLPPQQPPAPPGMSDSHLQGQLDLPPDRIQPAPPGMYNPHLQARLDLPPQQLPPGMHDPHLQARLELPDVQLELPPPEMPILRPQARLELPDVQLEPVPSVISDLNFPEKAETPADEPEKAPPPHEPPPKPPNVWIYAGEAYDLSDFIKRHPGGAFFIGRMRNRDITTLVNIFHPNPEKVKKVLNKYALNRKAAPEDIHPKYTAPEFLFCEDFNGWRDTPKFKFENKEQLLNQIRAKLNTPEMKQKIDRMDSLFDAVTIALFFAYILVQFLRLNFTQYMPVYLFVPLMVVLRISISGAGHYLIHRAQVRLNKAFSQIFDINYVPMAFVVTDGHNLMHHPFTQSEVDIKRNVFTAMLELPRYYRIPLHTIHKLAHVLTGMSIRATEIFVLGFKFGVEEMYGSWQASLLHYVGLFAMRILLVGELIVFWLHGDLGAWLAQFFLTVWLSTFMIVASHDFEDEAEVKVDAIEKQDWAVFQIQNSYDLTMIGNKYVDCFLSAGLSPHRVHHVLPYQKSGFANIISEDIVREEAEKFNLVWLQPKNFFLDRLPKLTKHYLFAPSRTAKEKNFGLLREHLHPQALLRSAQYILKGFTGIGSI